MIYFSKDFLNFFKELEKNNTKEWFDINRKRYEKTVKEPFKAFFKDLVEEMQRFYPQSNLAESSSIIRINRDIRFSKDKTPYKLHTGTMIMPHGKKNYSLPGMFVQMNHEDVRVYSGMYSMEKEKLYRLRSHIAENLQEFDKIVHAKDFKSLFGEIRGEKNKRIDKEFVDAAEKQPLIYNKSFYYFFKLKPEAILKEDLIEQLTTGFEKSLPINQFFEEALC